MNPENPKIGEPASPDARKFSGSATYAAKMIYCMCGPSSTGSVPRRHCRRCGERMETVVRRDGFCPGCGKVVLRLFLKCPRRSLLDCFRVERPHDLVCAR